MRKKRILSEDHKEKIRKALLGRIPANRGIPMAEEIRQKISQTMKGRAPANIDQIAGRNKGGGAFRICKGCGDQFQSRYDRTHNQTLYCTRACWQQHFVSPQKGQPRLDIRGPRHFNWKGGVTSEASAARGSLEAKAWREAVLARDSHTCQHCGQQSDNLHAHHIQLFSAHPELRYDLSNGVTLCKPCHRRPGLHTWSRNNN